MSYFFSRKLDKEIRQVRELVENKLKEQGFGIVSEINMTAKFKEKLGIEFRPYVILGACSPKHAHKAVSEEPHIGLMLPCNVVLQELEPGTTEISVIDPVASMIAVENEKLAPVAEEIRARLESFVNDL